MFNLAHPSEHPFTEKVAVTVFTSPACVQCVGTKHYLEKLGIPARFIDVSESPDAAAFLKAEGFAALPVVFPADPNVKPWAGFRPTLLDGLAKGAAA